MLEIVAGDLEPDLLVTLTADGEPIPIGNAPVEVMVKRGGETSWRFERPMQTISDGLEGRPAQALYEWQDGDTDEEGVYLCRFKITWDDGEPQTVPSGGRVRKFRITG